MANNLIQVKRTSISGRAANTVTLPNPGELALNMTDGILYSTNGSVVFEIGANNTNARVSNTLTVKAISANGSNGTSGQVLTTNGTATYWSAAGGSDTIPTQNTTPLSPTDGKLYWNSDLGKLILYYDDGDTQQWVEATPTGEPGPKGDSGNAAFISVGTVTTGAPGSSASVTNSGNTSVAVFDFSIPQGLTGNAATVSVGSTTTANAGTPASVSNLGNTSQALLSFTIPKGDTGNKGGILYNAIAPGLELAGDITLGRMLLNNTNFSDITNVILSSYDFSNNLVNNAIAVLDDSTSTIKSYLTFKSNSGNTIAVFSVSTASYFSNTWTVGVSPIAGNVFSFGGEIVTLEFSRTGDKGDTGATGATGNTGPFGPKSITIAQPQATDNVTMFYVNTGVTISRIQTLVKGATPTTNTSFFYRDSTGSVTTIQSNILTNNTIVGNSITSFTNNLVPANSYIYVTVNATTGTVDEYHATIFLS